MKHNFIILIAIGVAILIVGSIFSAYQLYKLVGIDAKCRGIKHPKFWGVIASSGNNQAGILLYMITRRNYPIISISDMEKTCIEKCKKKIMVGFIFIALGSIICVWGIFLI